MFTFGPGSPWPVSPMGPAGPGGPTSPWKPKGPKQWSHIDALSATMGWCNTLQQSLSGCLLLVELSRPVLRHSVIIDSAHIFTFGPAMARPGGPGMPSRPGIPGSPWKARVGKRLKIQFMPLLAWILNYKIHRETLEIVNLRVETNIRLKLPHQGKYHNSVK